VVSFICISAFIFTFPLVSSVLSGFFGSVGSSWVASLFFRNNIRWFQWISRNHFIFNLLFIGDENGDGEEDEEEDDDEEDDETEESEQEEEVEGAEKGEATQEEPTEPKKPESTEETNGKVKIKADIHVVVILKIWRWKFI
jgi:hypothetical protein